MNHNSPMPQAGRNFRDGQPRCWERRSFEARKNDYAKQTTHFAQGTTHV
jgi:hypothetical protein